MDYQKYLDYYDKQKNLHSKLESEISDLEVEQLRINELISDEKQVIKKINVNIELGKSILNAKNQIEKSEKKIRDLEKSNQQIKQEIEIKIEALDIISESISNLKPIGLHYKKVEYAKKGLDFIEKIKSELEKFKNLDDLLIEYENYHYSSFPFKGLSYDEKDVMIIQDRSPNFKVAYFLKEFADNHSILEHHKRNVLNYPIFVDFIKERENQYKKILLNNEVFTEIEEPEFY